MAVGRADALDELARSADCSAELLERLVRCCTEHRDSAQACEEDQLRRRCASFLAVADARRPLRSATVERCSLLGETEAALCDDVRGLLEDAEPGPSRCGDAVLVCEARCWLELALTDCSEASANDADAARCVAALGALSFDARCACTRPSVYFVEWWGP